VDPDNRLVASELERRWNDKLIEALRLEDELEAFDTQRQPVLLFTIPRRVGEFLGHRARAAKNEGLRLYPDTGENVWHGDQRRNASAVGKPGAGSDRRRVFFAA